MVFNQSNLSVVKEVTSYKTFGGGVRLLKYVAVICQKDKSISSLLINSSHLINLGHGTFKKTFLVFQLLLLEHTAPFKSPQPYL